MTIKSKLRAGFSYSCFCWHYYAAACLSIFLNRLSADARALYLKDNYKSATICTKNMAAAIDGSTGALYSLPSK